jgi:hypothetical protein
LQPGDELRVGPLKFRVDERAAATDPAKRTDIPRGKQAAVKDVADVAQRSVGKSDAGTTEDDISRWLLGVPDSKPGDSLKETRTIRMEETTTINKPLAAPKEIASADPDAGEESAPVGASTNGASENGAGAAEQAGRWGWLKGGKGQAKKKPGKLPPRQAEPSSKDSREAAADLIREMMRRR